MRLETAGVLCRLQLGIRTGPSSRAPSVVEGLGQSDADGSSPSTGRGSPSAPSASGFFGGLRVGVHTMNDFGKVSPTSCTLHGTTLFTSLTPIQTTPTIQYFPTRYGHYIFPEFWTCMACDCQGMIFNTYLQMRARLAV